MLAAETQTRQAPQVCVSDVLNTFSNILLDSYRGQSENHTVRNSVHSIGDTLCQNRAPPEPVPKARQLAGKI